MKVRDDARLRERVAGEEAEKICNAASALRERIDRGGKLMIFGNGGSATDANDWAIDCFMPPAGYHAVRGNISFHGAGQSLRHCQ